MHDTKLRVDVANSRNRYFNVECSRKNGYSSITVYQVELTDDSSDDY